ncbi:uncharacterized protein E5676_scaffold313G003760 [Cucumis melo var. makuwa]|uniref:Gag protease polyprotein n=1 Tax=Cucumis melo var. makuwa TaxID=1194695 RepID=A0A5A7V2G3_CUCMM|nr:uncharacterized protein E6C27_scaffold154G00130 [Cucumis melo var. makuwa]TYK26714.1 uncharacterized protein E5676_scaffold313G003760 [Cucumis melo var. makuwa]
MSPSISAHRGGKGDRGARHNQPEDHSILQTVDPTAPITNADLVTMEQMYRDMLTEALTQFQPVHKTQPALVQALMVPKNVSDEL